MKILLPLDGSEAAESAVPTAQALARRWNASVVLLRTVGPEVEGSAGVLATLALRLHQHHEQFADAYLQEMETRFPGIQVQRMKRVGCAREMVATVATEQQCDLIVMASHGRSGPQRWLLGSVAETALRQAPCPVLLIRAAQRVETPGEFRHILVPVDGSPLSEQVLCRLGPYLQPGATITLLRVTGLSEKDCAFVPDPRQLEDVVQELQNHLGELTVEGARVIRKVLHGDPAQVIAAVAEESGFDLVAMATHGRSGWKHFVLGSVMERVARTAACPVLAFPASQF